MAERARAAAPDIASQELVRGLRAAVDQVFATMLSTLGLGPRLGEACLLDPLAQDAARDPAAITIEARVDIDGPLQGWIRLACTASAADGLARDFLKLGPGDALTRAEVEDALGECANLIAGVLKTEILDPRGRFAIGLPRLRVRPTASERPSGTLAYRLCAGALDAELWLARRAEPA